MKNSFSHQKMSQSKADQTVQYASAGPEGASLALPNRTGLPNDLKTGIESLSGLSLDDVRVHYNSPKPVQLQAFAYTQGTDIHVGPGQERHLPHEAWHVVQQKQGRVKPTMQVGDVSFNNQPALEQEADSMSCQTAHPPGSGPTNHGQPVIQGKFFVEYGKKIYDVVTDNTAATKFMSWLNSKGVSLAPIHELKFWELAEADESYSLLHWFNYHINQPITNENLLSILQSAGIPLDNALDKLAQSPTDPLKRKINEDVRNVKRKKFETFTGGSLYDQKTESSGEGWKTEVKNSLITKEPDKVPTGYDFGSDPQKLKRPLPSGNYPIGIPVEYNPEVLDYTGAEDIQAMRHIADLIYNRVRVEEKKKEKKDRDMEAEIQLMFIPKFNIIVGSGNKGGSAGNLKAAVNESGNPLKALSAPKEEGYKFGRTVPSRYKLGELLLPGSERQEKKGKKATSVASAAFESGDWKFLSVLDALNTLKGSTESQFIFLDEPKLDQVHAEQKLALLAVLLNKEGVLDDTDEVIIAGTKIACRACGTMLPHWKKIYQGITFERHSHTDVGSGLGWQGTYTEQLDTLNSYIQNPLNTAYSSKGGLSGIGFPTDIASQMRGQLKSGFSDKGKSQKVHVSQRPYNIDGKKGKFNYTTSIKPTKFVRPSSPSPVRPEESMRLFCINFSLLNDKPYYTSLLKVIWPKLFIGESGINYSAMSTFAPGYIRDADMVMISSNMEKYINSGSVTWDQLVLNTMQSELEDSITYSYMLSMIEKAFSGNPPWKVDGTSKWLATHAGSKLHEKLKLDFTGKKFL